MGSVHHAASASQLQAMQARQQRERRQVEESRPVVMKKKSGGKGGGGGGGGGVAGAGVKQLFPDLPAAFTDLGYDFEADEALPGLLAPTALAQRAMRQAHPPEAAAVAAGTQQEWGLDKNLRLEQLWIEGGTAAAAPEADDARGDFPAPLKDDDDDGDGAAGAGAAGAKEAAPPPPQRDRHRAGRSPSSPMFVDSMSKPPRVGARWMTWLCATRRPPRHSAAVAPRAAVTAASRASGGGGDGEAGRDSRGTGATSSSSPTSSSSASSSPEPLGCGGAGSRSGSRSRSARSESRSGRLSEPGEVPRSGCLGRPSSAASAAAVDAAAAGAPEERGRTDAESAAAAAAAAEVEEEDVCLQVPEGMLALAWLDGQPVVLAAGTHSFAAQGFSMKELVPESTRVIHHGSLHRVVIPAEHVGIAWVNGKPEILEPGVHQRSCTTFSYSPRNDQSLMDKELVLGPFRIVTVNEDEVGIKFRNRRPSVLYRGRHTIDISKAEVFAGFESLCCRRSRIADLVATTADDMRVEAQLSFTWQIGPDDAACARLANVADTEGAVTAKFRRAFALVMWCYKGCDIVDMHAKSDDLSADDAQLVHVSQMSASFSSDISKECLEVVVDLFEEGWTVTFWEVQLERLQLYLDTPTSTPDEQSCQDSITVEQEACRQKKKLNNRGSPRYVCVK